MPETSFPVVSFQSFISGSEMEKRAVAQQLYDAFHTFGWIYLKDFGISETDIDQMFAIVSLSRLWYHWKASHQDRRARNTLIYPLRKSSSKVYPMRRLIKVIHLMVQRQTEELITRRSGIPPSVE